MQPIHDGDGKQMPARKLRAVLSQRVAIAPYNRLRPQSSSDFLLRRKLGKAGPHVLSFPRGEVAGGRTLRRPVTYGLLRMILPGGW